MKIKSNSLKYFYIILLFLLTLALGYVLLIKEDSNKEKPVFIIKSSADNPGCIEVSEKGSDTWKHFYLDKKLEATQEGACK